MIPWAVDVFVPGRPFPQGSKSAKVRRGRIFLVESSEGLKPWRESVAATLRQRRYPTIVGAAVVDLEFVMPRPKDTPKRSTPPALKRPDADKLARGVLDALSMARVYEDDARVVDLHAVKRIAEIGETPGCRIRVRAASVGVSATDFPTECEDASHE